MKVLFVSAAVLAADQFSKIWLKGISIPELDIYLEGLIPGVNYPVLADYVNLTLLENPGFAFGIDPGTNFKFALTFLTLIITACLFVFLYMSKNDPLKKRTAIALLIGGAIGNLIDRIFYGEIFGYAPLFYGNVVDFINIKMSGSLPGQIVGNYVFNVADIAVFCGLLLMIFSLQTAVQREREILAAENQE